MTLPRLIKLTDFETDTSVFVDFNSIIAIRRLEDPDFIHDARTRIDYRTGDNQSGILLVNENPDEIMAKGGQPPIIEIAEREKGGVQ